MSSISSLSFNPCYVGLWSVSRERGRCSMGRAQRFNPCYVGLWSVRVAGGEGGTMKKSFNPCYVGLWSVRWPSELSTV